MAVSMESEKNGRVRSSYTCAYVAAVLNFINVSNSFS